MSGPVIISMGDVFIIILIFRVKYRERNIQKQGWRCKETSKVRKKGGRHVFCI